MLNLSYFILFKSYKAPKLNTTGIRSFTLEELSDLPQALIRIFSSHIFAPDIADIADQK